MRGVLSKEKSRIILNIILPVLTGVLIYLMMSPSVLFIKETGVITGRDIHQSSITEDFPLLYTIRCYLPDMLWGYALMFALFLSCGRDRKLVGFVFFLTAIFSVIMECLQLMPAVFGSFDSFDIAVEISAELLALIIINKTETGGEWK